MNKLKILFSLVIIVGATSFYVLDWNLKNRVNYMLDSYNQFSKTIFNYNHDFAIRSLEFISFKFDPNKPCSIWKLSTKNDSEKPRIVLDSKKFLYPAVIWGPNNQLIMFYQTVYLAIKLNRTLVLPIFKSHHTNKNIHIQANRRIDVSHLKRFVSTISVEDMVKKCNGIFDIAFQGYIYRSYFVRTLQKDTSMKFKQMDNLVRSQNPEATKIRVSDKEKHNFGVLPGKAYDDQLQKTSWIKMNTKFITKVFNSTSPCAAYLSKHNSLHINFREFSSPLNSNVDWKDASDNELYSAVLDAVKLPHAIQISAQQFVNKHFHTNDFVAVHWRYDLEEWGKVYMKQDSSRIMYDNLLKIQPIHVARGIEAKLESLKLTSIKFVYIAVMPSLMNFAEQIASNLTLNAQVGCQEFITKNHLKCLKKNNWDKSEVISMLDMEICSRSFLFFYSYLSSWSNNVQRQRTKNLNKEFQQRSRRLEFSIYSVSLKEMQKSAEGSGG